MKNEEIIPSGTHLIDKAKQEIIEERSESLIVGEARKTAGGDDALDDYFEEEVEPIESIFGNPEMSRYEQLHAMIDILASDLYDKLIELINEPPTPEDVLHTAHDITAFFVQSVNRFKEEEDDDYGEYDLPLN